ncbi:uncharacterized protein LOC134270197 [Saccostrea cucullata]|uniref:uncharacterized protein LOC134270197 n=1 Tax=Saccostrea cuccullata TaxID=36930 RepID=UPI002ED5AACF
MLKHFDPARYMSERNGPLLAFLKGLMHEGDFYQKEKAVVISNAVDSVYYLVNTKFVAPLAFAKSLLIYTKTGSKEGVNVASAATPSGSYTSILNWLKANSQEKIKIPDNSDVISFFDNNQVIGRKWRVKNDFKAESSVITSVAHMQPRSDIQRNMELAPSKWQSFHVQAKKDSLEKLKAQEILFEKDFSKSRHGFISKRINEIIKQQSKEDGWKDHVDKKKDHPREIDPPNERYTFIPSCHEAGPSKVIAGEPIFENPCSYEAVEKVLDHLLEEAEVGTTRHWTAVGCDGLPYVLASRIIEELYICPTCRIQYDEDEFINHIETSKHANDLEEGRKYRNILMLAGHGHFEINMTKALFKLLWDVCLLMELAKMLGFKSPKALAACQAAHGIEFIN